MLRTRTLRRTAALAAGLLAACGGASGAPPAAEGPVLIGAPWPWELRGSIRYGEGMQLALDEVNAAGGVHGRPLALLALDDHEEVDRGRLVAQELARDRRVVAVVGHLQSYVTVPAAAAYDLAGLVLVAPTATSPELTRRGYKRVFRATFSDQNVGHAMADYALRQGYRRVAIYYSRDEYGRGLANAFEERLSGGGGRVLDRRSYDVGEPGGGLPAAGAVEAWRELAPEGVFIAGDGEAGARLAVALRRGGIRVPLLGGDALAIPAFLELGGAAVEGTVVPTRFSAETPTAEVRRFTAAFRERYGADPDVGAALGYDAVRVLAEAMRRAPTVTPEAVAAALRQGPAFQGVTGSLRFDPAGELADAEIRKVVVRGGAFRHLREEPFPAAGGAPR